MSLGFKRLKRVVNGTCVLCVFGKTADDRFCVCVCVLVASDREVNLTKEKAIEFGSDFCTDILSNVGWC